MKSGAPMSENDAKRDEVRPYVKTAQKRDENAAPICENGAPMCENVTKRDENSAPMCENAAKRDENAAPMCENGAIRDENVSWLAGWLAGRGWQTAAA